MSCNTCGKHCGCDDCRKRFHLEGTELIIRNKDTNGNLFVETVNGISGIVYQEDIEEIKE